MDTINSGIIDALNNKINNLHKEINELKECLNTKEKKLLSCGKKIHDLNNQLFKKEITLNNSININKQFKMKLYTICKNLDISLELIDEDIKDWDI